MTERGLLRRLWIEAPEEAFPTVEKELASADPSGRRWEPVRSEGSILLHESLLGAVRPGVAGFRVAYFVPATGVGGDADDRAARPERQTSGHVAS